MDILGDNLEVLWEHETGLKGRRMKPADLTASTITRVTAPDIKPMFNR